MDHDVRNEIWNEGNPAFRTLSPDQLKHWVLQVQAMMRTEIYRLGKKTEKGFKKLDPESLRSQEMHLLMLEKLAFAQDFFDCNPNDIVEILEYSKKNPQFLMNGSN